MMKMKTKIPIILMMINEVIMNDPNLRSLENVNGDVHFFKLPFLI